MSDICNVMKKAIWLIIEDSREGGAWGTATICDSPKVNSMGVKIFTNEEKAYKFWLSRVWYVETDRRAYIDSVRKTMSPKKAYETISSLWLYCPTIEKKFIEV